MSITKTLSKLSAGGGRPLSDTDLLKWANTTVQNAKPTARTIRSFKDPSLTTSLFILDLLDAIHPGIVDPSLVIVVSETGDYEEKRQNGTLTASTASMISIKLIPRFDFQPNWPSQSRER